MGRKWGAVSILFSGGGELSPHLHKVAWDEAYLHTKRRLSPSSHLATTHMARKWGLCPLGEEALGPHIPQYGLD